MVSQDRCAAMTSTEILREFEQYLAIYGASSHERAVSIPIAAAVIEIWCFMRDDDQFAASALCLSEFAPYSGFSAVAHHLRRHDIPKSMIEKAKTAFGVSDVSV